MSQTQNPQSSSSCRIKPKITLKKLRGSSNTVIIKSPDNNILTSGESTMSTLEGIVHENQPTGSPIYLVDQEVNAQEPSDQSHRSYQNMFVEAQPSPHAVYKSTLANLCDGLATLNEGEYVQWDTEQKQPQTTILSQKSIENSGRKQRPMSVHMYAPPGSCNNSRTETPIGRERPHYRSVSKAHARIVKNCGVGEIDFICRRNYESVVPVSQDQPQNGKDLRWKGSGSMHEDLEILKTEESLETMKKINRENTECVPVVILKDRYQRSSSVKNRRPLTQEFEEWKVTLMERKEALAEKKKEQLKKEKAVQQQEVKKEDMVLPKLNIGGENLGSSVKQEKEKDTVVITKHTSRFGEMRKTKLKWGGGRPTSKKKTLSINVKENRENVLERSHSRKESQEIAVQTLEIQKVPKEVKPIARLSSHHGSASMIIWDEETLLQNMEQRNNEQIEHEKVQSDQWKQRCLVPKMKVKQDLVLKKQMMLMQQRVKSRAESRERSRERSAEIKYDMDKVIKGYRETVGRKGVEGYYSCGNDVSATEACTAQNILDQRLKTLEEKYVSQGREQRKSLDQKRLSRSSLGEQEGNKSKGREGSGKIMKISFVMNTNLKKVGTSVRQVV